MGPSISNTDILSTLQELNASVASPLWLFGGVAVDFLVGHWTRSHSDIDLNTLSLHREKLTYELSQIGYRTSDSGWLTIWSQAKTGRRLEIVFLERDADGSPELHIRKDDPVGIPGKYPILPDYLEPNRFASLGGVTFRVSSPAGEWLGRAAGLDVVGGRVPEPKLEHDRRLLEGIISAESLVNLRAIIAKRAAQSRKS